MLHTGPYLYQVMTPETPNTRKICLVRILEISDDSIHRESFIRYLYLMQKEFNRLPWMYCRFHSRHDPVYFIHPLRRSGNLKNRSKKWKRSVF